MRNEGDRSYLNPVPNPDNREGQLPAEILRFTQEAREALERKGYVIYGLKGESIQSLKEAGRPICQTWENRVPPNLSKVYKHRLSYPEFDEMPSMRSEVGINPTELYLSTNKREALKEQEARVKEFSRKLSRIIPGTAAIIGQAPDYIELGFQHLDATGQLLFGEDFNDTFATTKTSVGTYDNDEYVAVVGNYGGPKTLAVQAWPTEYATSVINAADFSDASFQRAFMYISGPYHMKALHTQEVRTPTTQQRNMLSGRFLRLALRRCPPDHSSLVSRSRRASTSARMAS
jgi:hypothetical protein